MESPSEEIADIVLRIIATGDPNTQKETVLKYFTENAALKHPLLQIPHGPNSRNEILAIYQFYRTLSPKVKADVRSVVFDQENNAIVLDINQTHNLRFSPFAAAPWNVKTCIELDKKGDLWYINAQEDYFHPEDLCKLICSPLTPVVTTLLAMARRLILFWNTTGQFLGFWCPDAKGKVPKENEPTQDTDNDSREHLHDTEQEHGQHPEEWRRVGKKGRKAKKRSIPNFQQTESRAREKDDPSGHDDSPGGCAPA